MELIESDDPKAMLLRKAAEQKRALNNDVGIISDKTEKAIKTALIIGGALAATYLLYNLFSGNSSKKKTKKKIKVISATKADEDDQEIMEVNESPFAGIVSKVGTTIANQAAAFILAMAKEKLGEYLETRAEKKDVRNDL